MNRQAPIPHAVVTVVRRRDRDPVVTIDLANPPGVDAIEFTRSILEPLGLDLDVTHTDIPNRPAGTVNE